MIKIISLRNCSPQDYKSLVPLNLGYDGIMRDVLRDAYKDGWDYPKPLVKAIVLYIENVPTSWALLYTTRSHRSYINIFTKKSCRKMGYADRIMRYIVNIYWPKIHNDKIRKPRLHCQGNPNFFRKYGIRY